MKPLLTLQAPVEESARSHPVARAGRLWQWCSEHHWVVALAGYSLMTLVVTFPLVLHLGDSIAGPYLADDSLWYTWYPYAFRTALAAGQDPSYTHLLYALLPHIQLFAASDVNGAAGALLLTFMVPLAAFNVLILVNFALSGLAAYLLVGEFVRNRWAAFVAGSLYTFSTYHFWRVLSGLSLTSMQYMPLVAWRVFAFYRRPTWANAAWMGLSLALMPLSDFYLTAYFLPAFALLFLAGMLIADRAWFADRRHLLRGAAGLALAALIALPLLASSLHSDPAELAAIAAKTTSTEHYSANLIAYFLAQPANPLLGGFTARLYSHVAASYLSPETAGYLGWVGLALAAFGLLATRPRPRALYFWLALGVSTFLMSLGPSLQVGGHVLLRLPFYGWLYNLPLLSTFRAPNRMAPVVLLAMCVLAAYGLVAIFARVRRFADAHPVAPERVRRAAVPALGVVVICASLAESIPFSFPYPFTSVPIPSVYQQMADDPVPGLVLTLPVYPKGQDMFYQTIAHRGLVTGYPIRTTYPMIRTFENIPGVSLFDWPDSIQANDPAAADQGQLHDVFPLQETLLQGLQANDIRYVVLRADTTGPIGLAFPAILPWMRPYLERALGAPFYGSSAYGLWVWRIPRAAVDPNVIRFAMGDGWMPGLQVYSNTVVRRVLEDAELDVYVPASATAHLQVTAAAYGRPYDMEISLNGTTLKTASFAQPFQYSTVDLGAVPLHAGENILHFANTQACAEHVNTTFPATLDPLCVKFLVSSVQLVESPQH